MEQKVIFALYLPAWLSLDKGQDNLGIFQQSHRKEAWFVHFKIRLLCSQ
jgi:hypothetical protein